jgi:hypothetical protein
MRKELFYVAASRGRDRIAVVTSDKDLLRESVARSVARQSASELSRKAQQPSLRERERRQAPVAHELGCDNAHKGQEPLRQTPVSETAQTIDREKTGHDQKQEHIIEAGHYFGIGR